MSVSLAEFEKALAALKDALSYPKTEMNRDATIQRFEFTIELAWKTARRVMGTTSSAPKEVVREMARNGLINDPEKWFDALDGRNLSSHSYKEEIAEMVYQTAASFAEMAELLLGKMKQK